MKSLSLRLMLCGTLSVLLLTACSSPTRASQPAGQTDATDHAPVILRVEERQKTKGGKLTYYKDVYYSDSVGDAEIVKFSLLSGKLLAGENLPESNAITDWADKQRHEAVLNFHWVCNSQQTFVLEVQVVDQAGNSSEPLTLTFPCSSASSTVLAPTPMPSGLTGLMSGKVDVGGYKLYYQCIGQGSPTIILEAGGPGDSTDWELVMLYYRETTRICAYDRANLGYSDEAPKPRTYLDMTRDLHALLVNASVEGPYILVGHSMGGMLVRLYADQYPEDVVGLVLVDSAHPDMGDQLLANLPSKSWGESKSLKAWRQYGSWLSASNGREPNNPEGVDAKIGNEQIRAVKSLGNLPLVVISRSPNNPVLAEAMPSLLEETNTKLLRMWQDLQAELMDLSSNSTRVIADHSGHDVNKEEPRLVIDAILKLVNEYRGHTGVIISPADETDVSNHPPAILEVAERQETKDGFLIIHKDITFIDPDGDAITVVNTVVSATQPRKVKDDIIRTPPDEQKGQAVVTSSFGCSKQLDFEMEYRIYDKAGNMSEPVTATISCPPSKNRISPSLTVGLGIGVGLFVGVWLLGRYRHSSRARVSRLKSN